MAQLRKNGETVIMAVTAAQLIDYLQQFDLQTPVVATSDDMESPGNFIDIDFVICEIEETASETDHSKHGK